MDGADVFRTENIREKSGDRCEPTAVHREHDEQAGEKHRPVAVSGENRNQQKKKKLNDKERRVRIPAADVIGT